MNRPAPIEIYVALMEDVKHRIAIVKSFPDPISFGSLRFDYECIALHLRKVLELIAFGSLCANQAAYASVHSDFEKHWNAKWLLRDLRKVHADFYPKPVTVGDSDTTPGTKRVTSLDSGFLSEDEFVELYDKCSQVLHTRNPFKVASQIDFRLTSSQWADRIVALLKVHYLRLAGVSNVWIVTMTDPRDGKVHAGFAEPYRPQT